MLLESIDLARYVVSVVEERKAEDILLLDLRGVSIIADYFVICSASSERQLRAITQNVIEHVKKEHSIRPFQVDGEASGGWVLLDYSDVIVHAFSPDTRSYYNLEGFWQDASVVVRIQ